MGNSNKKLSKKEYSLVSQSLQLFGSFYPKFYLLESQLKYKLFNLLQEKLGQNWLSQQLHSENSETLFKEEKAIILRRKRKGFLLTDQSLFNESSLGFWVEFFNRRIYKITKGLPLAIFENRPKEVKRKEIYQKLTQIKELRNLLFHSRLPPITNEKELKLLEHLEEVAQELETLLQWFGDLPVKLIEASEIISKSRSLRQKLITK